MKTVCQTCRSSLVQRVWFAQDPPLFIEGYGCGSVRAFGIVVNAGVVRSCPNPPAYEQKAAPIFPEDWPEIRENE